MNGVHLWSHCTQALRELRNVPVTSLFSHHSSNPVSEAANIYL